MTPRIPKLEKFDPVYIEWYDAVTIRKGSWVDMNLEIEDFGSGLLIKNIGFFVKETKGYLHFIRGYDCKYKEDGLGLHAIPIGCIKKIKKIKL